MRYDEISPQAKAIVLVSLNDALNKGVSVNASTWDALISNKTFGEEIRKFYDGFFDIDAHGNTTTKFIPSYAAEFITNEFPFIVLDGVFYFYKGGVFVPDRKRTIVTMLINGLIVPTYRNTNKIKEVITQLLAQPANEKDFSEVNDFPLNWICFKNGMYDPIEKKMHPHDPKYLCINQIPFDYNPDAECSGDTVEKYLSDICQNEDDRRMLLMYAGYCMTHDTRLQMFMNLYGKPNTGKSTLINFLSNIIGISNISNVSLDSLCTNRFASYNVVGKLCNLCADIEAKAIEEPATIKQLIGEDTISVERKGMDQFSVRPYTRYMFSSNDLPPIRSRDGAFFRRILVLPISKAPDIPNENLLHELKEESDYMIHICMDALHDYYQLANKRDIASENSRRLTNYWQTKGDTIVAFLTDKQPFKDNPRMLKTAFDAQYATYCQEEERQALKPNSIKAEMLNSGYTTIQVNGYWYYYSAKDDHKKDDPFKTAKNDETPFTTEE